MTKITVDRALLEQALEALKYLSVTAEHRVDDRQPDAAMAALRQALFQEEQQEPVAWMYQWKTGADRRYVSTAKWPESSQWTEWPLYTHTPLGCDVCGLGSMGVVTNYACTRNGCPIKATAQ
jgi:hypothetical protein